MPPLTGRVNDLAGLLPDGRRAALEAKLARLEEETSHQIVVLTLPSLEGEPIEDFSIRVAEAWRIGQKGLDNGVILVVAPNDRRARIEVGYGLEGVIPDAVAARILRDAVFPRFRQGDFAGGVEAGVDAIALASRGETVPVERRTGGEGGEFRGDPITLALFVGLFIGLFVGAFSAPLGRAFRPVGALAGGGLAAGLAWLLLRLVPPAAIGGLVGAAVAWMLTSAHGLPSGGGRRHRGGYGGGFGGGWGGGSGGFGGGGGGFGGGGGGFGGGGASGSW